MFYPLEPPWSRIGSVQLLGVQSWEVFQVIGGWGYFIISSSKPCQGTLRTCTAPGSTSLAAPVVESPDLRLRWIRWMAQLFVVPNQHCRMMVTESWLEKQCHFQVHRKSPRSSGLRTLGLCMFVHVALSPCQVDHGLYQLHWVCHHWKLSKKPTN
jgi:hypothetical protein